MSQNGGEGEVFRLLMPAGEIPLESHVTKRTGEKLFVLRDRLRVFGEGGEKREIVCQDGARFLVQDSGDANVVNADTILCWHASRFELERYLEETPQ